MLGCCLLTLRPTKAHYFYALGHACKFVLRCKNLYRIGPRLGLGGVARSFYVRVAPAALKSELRSWGTGPVSNQGGGGVRIKFDHNYLPIKFYPYNCIA